MSNISIRASYMSLIFLLFMFNMGIWISTLCGDRVLSEETPTRPMSPLQGARAHQERVLIHV
jgi:hypothetical protein